MSASSRSREFLFKGRKLVLLGTKKRGGALTTPKAYREGTSSYAELYPDGNILRFGEQIGTRKDLKFTGKFVELTIELGALMNLLTHPSWLSPGEPLP